MRELSVAFSQDGKAVLGSARGYQDEHCAVCLAVTPASDMTAAEPDEYYISFVRDADADNPMPQKLTVGPVQDIREGVLYYELPSSLTATTCLAVQLEAVKYDANGSVAAAMKSPAFQLVFHPSLQGEEVLPVTQEMNGLLVRLLNAASDTLAVKDSVSAALAQGQLNARINGHNAITLSGGANLSVSDNNGAVTLDCVTLPIVSALPQNPQEGDVVLLVPQNEIAPRDAKKELKTSADMLAAVAAAEREILALSPTSRCPIYLNLRKDGRLVGFVSMTSDLEEDGEGQLKAVTIISFVTEMHNNRPYYGFELAYVDGAFLSERSGVIEKGNALTLSTIPDSVRLPDFDTVEEIEYEALALPVFFGSSSLWAYRSRWLEVTSVTAEKYTHSNIATLDSFYCDASEVLANTPEGQIPIALQYTGWDRLHWDGAEVRMVDDGGVIDRVETVTVNGKSYLRLWMDYGEVQTIYMGMGDRPDFIDIPIDSATASTVTQGGLTVNGTEVDLGIDALEADAHTHANKATLDDIGEVEMFAGGNIARFESRPFNDTPSYSYNVSGDYSGYLYGGAIVMLSQPMTGAITITGFSNFGNYRNPEYMVEFTTGATAPTLTLPASVEWEDELTVESNKHYQISILNNIALWCAVDVEAEE